MKAILDTSSFFHNTSELNFEWLYRIKDLESNINVQDFINGEEYLDLIHWARYIQKIKRACEMNANLAEVSLTSESYIAACNAVGLTILASQQNDFAIVRPPWHHAFRELASWFCFFNNIAIAAQKLVNEWKKVAIIDIDGHHWDGTQRIFFETDEVYFTSIHQVGVFPWTGYQYEVWKWKGLWFTKNFPLEKGASDKDFLYEFNEALSDIKDFNPDIVWVSVGFDGYYKDRALDMNFSLELYREIWKRFSENFENIFAVLEWWYHEDIKECVDMFLDGINAEKWE